MSNRPHQWRTRNVSSDGIVFVRVTGRACGHPCRLQLCWTDGQLGNALREAVKSHGHIEGISIQSERRNFGYSRARRWLRIGAGHKTRERRYRIMAVIDRQTLLVSYIILYADVCHKRIQRRQSTRSADNIGTYHC